MISMGDSNELQQRKFRDRADIFPIICLWQQIRTFLIELRKNRAIDILLCWAGCLTCGSFEIRPHGSVDNAAQDSILPHKFRQSWCYILRTSVGANDEETSPRK
jgi:hypothetical protein